MLEAILLLLAASFKFSLHKNTLSLLILQFLSIRLLFLFFMFSKWSKYFQDDFGKLPPGLHGLPGQRRDDGGEVEDDNRTTTTHESMTSLLDVYPVFSRDQPGAVIGYINCLSFSHLQLSCYFEVGQ